MITGHYERIQDYVSSPSPIALINVLNPSGSTNRVKVRAILDIAAGITLIPQSIIDELGSLQYTVISVRSPFDNKTLSTKLYSIIIEVGEQVHEVEVVGIPRGYAMIGRDILNQYKIIFNGPEETWSIE